MTEVRENTSRYRNTQSVLVFVCVFVCVCVCVCERERDHVRVCVKVGGRVDVRETAKERERDR